MEISKAPPLTSNAGPATASRDSAGELAGRHAQAGAGADRIADDGAGAAAPPAAQADRIDIRSLAPLAALQILIAEVRSSCGVPFAASLAAPPADPHAAAPVPATLIDLFLCALPPPTSDAAHWSVAAASAEQTFAVALDRAVTTVMAWRNVAPEVTATVKQVQALVSSMLVEEPPSPLWLSPEWVGLRPRVANYWRRRRLARRRLSDPDYTQRQWEEDVARSLEEREPG